MLGRARHFLVAVLIVAAALLPQAPALALDLTDVAAVAPSVELQPPFLGALDTGLRDQPIERPDATTTIRNFMTLQAKGPGPRFHWVAAAFRNSSSTARSMVIVVPQQGFVGSRVYPVLAAGSPVVSITTAGAVSLERLPDTGQDTFAFTLEPGATGVVAFETIDQRTPLVSLWQRASYDARKDFLAFFRGALLGVGLLLALALFALYGFRSRAVFPAAGGFALAGLAFMVLEAGHLPALVETASQLSLQSVRAIVEGTMAAFLLVLLVLVTELHRIARLGGNLLMLLGGLAFAVPIYGLAEPALAVSLARAIFAATAVGGFILVFVLWRKGEARAETALVSWSAILLWTFLAAVAALSGSGKEVLSPLLMAGLCGVLVVLSFTLAHLAFSQGYLSRHFFREAGRHALAMAGARSYVWDWQPEEGDLFVSDELERTLAQPRGLFAQAGSEAFLELMHPSDRNAYLAAIEEACQASRLPVEREFRLRHADGAYRWFQLRARAITGHGQRALRCVGTLVDVTQAKLAEQRLLSDAVYDLVTGLPNRALFADRLARALEGTRQAGGIYVMLVDIDRFKLVNEAMGHEAGDALLAVIGRRLKGETAAGGSIARLPGDQFAVMFLETEGSGDAAAYAETLLKAVARPIMLDEQEYFLTACIGVAGGRDAAGSAEQLIKDAALALYEAKRRGTEVIELFNPALRDDRAELIVLEQDLRRAIERNEIEVHFQPIARLSDMHLAGFEALIRWRHPNLGLLLPESFVSLAEQTGMIRELGRAVLNESGRQLGIWQRAHRTGEPVFVAVNISSAQLIETSLIDDVRQLLTRENLLRGSLKIEVTESLVMQFPERAGHILERFREMGVGVSCDDFGTGYSSLSSLRKLPFDTLKVDQSFIAADPADGRATVILDAVITMAHALGLTVVAEGIENQDQVDRLGALGCDLGQGFFIGRPMTARQVNEALAGLPYASSSGRTAITWLWERSQKDPPPEPKRRRMTAVERDTPKSQPPPARPAPAASIRTELPPPPGTLLEDIPPEMEAEPAPQPEAGSGDEMAEAETIAVPGSSEEHPAPIAEDAEGSSRAADDEDSPDQTAPSVDPLPKLPPRRRMRKRRG